MAIWQEVLEGQWGCVILPGTPHSLLYQERTGSSASIPAVADGDPVGTIHDRISGNTITAISDAGRPTLRIAGGVTWLEFDGTDDAIFALPGAFTGDTVYAICAHRRDSGNQRLLSLVKGGGDDWSRYTSAELIGRSFAGYYTWRNAGSTGVGVTLGGASPGDGADFVIEVQSGPTSALLAVDGGPDVSDSWASVGGFDVDRINILSENAGAFPADGRLYALLVVGAAPTSAQRAALVAAAAARISGGTDASVPGGVLTVAASLIGGLASGQRAPNVAGHTLAAAAELIAGLASAGATRPGDTLAAATTLIGGLASGVRAPSVAGRMLTPALSLVAGAARGEKSPTVAGRTLVAAASLVAGAAHGTGPPIGSKREQVLGALLAALTGSKPAGTTLLRNAVLPERIPAAGLLILRDGDPGEPAFLFSPPRYLYEHRAEIDVLVDGASSGRDTAFDAILQTIAQALAADRTLGGLVDFAIGEAPVPLDLPVEGAAGLKAATIDVLLSYDTGDPLA